MLRSMFSGVSGLQNHQERLDVVGNNIANVNTTGFKKGRVTFQDIMSQTVAPPTAPGEESGGVNPQQVGLGMAIGSRDEIHTQGSLETTGRATDLAIEGDGFFVLDGPEGEAFTRAGNFEVDANGRLIDIDSGSFVQGYQAENGEIRDDQVGNIEIPLDPVSPEASSRIEYEGNINSEIEDIIDEATAEFETETEFSDKEGTPEATAENLGSIAHLAGPEILDEGEAEFSFEAREIDTIEADGVGENDEANYALVKEVNGEEEIFALSEDGYNYEILKSSIPMEELEEYDAEEFDFAETIEFQNPVTGETVNVEFEVEQEEEDAEETNLDLSEVSEEDLGISPNTAYVVEETEIDSDDHNLEDDVDDIDAVLRDEDGYIVGVKEDEEDSYHILDGKYDDDDIDIAEIAEDENNNNIEFDFDEEIHQGWIHFNDFEFGETDQDITATHYTIDENVTFAGTSTVEFEDNVTLPPAGEYSVNELEDEESLEIDDKEYNFGLVDEDGEVVAWSKEKDPEENEIINATDDADVEDDFKLGDDNALQDDDEVHYEIVPLAEDIDEEGIEGQIGGNDEIDIEDIEYGLKNTEEQIVGVITEDELAILEDGVDYDDLEELENADLATENIDNDYLNFYNEDFVSELTSGYVTFEHDDENNGTLTAKHREKMADGNWINEEGEQMLNSGKIAKNDSMDIDVEFHPDSVETTTIQIFDQQGQQRTLTISFTKRGQNDWQGHIEEIDQYFDIEFDDQGNLVSESEIAIDGSDLRDNLEDFKFDEDEELILDLERITQAAGTTDLHAEADGQMQGNLESYEIDEAGVVTGTYDNGETEALAQIEMATFTNPAGLRKEGSNLFTENVNSGTPDKGVSGTGGRGDIAPGTLEMSNVDMSEEFTDMIVTQRGFQANSRTITTSDEVLEEIVNMTL